MPAMQNFGERPSASNIVCFANTFLTRYEKSEYGSIMKRGFRFVKEFERVFSGYRRRERYFMNLIGDYHPAAGSFELEPRNIRDKYIDFTPP